MRAGRAPRSRVRDVCLTQTDLETFTDFLRARFPDLYIFERDSVTSSIERLENLGYGKRQIEILPNAPSLLLDSTVFDFSINKLAKFETRYNDSVEIWRSQIQTLDLSKIRANSITRPINTVVRRLSPDGFIRSSYQVGEENKRRFVQSVFYLAGKFMTNDFDVYNLETREHHHTFRKSTLWAGPDAMRLGETDPDFYCTVYFDTDLNTWLGYKAIPRVRGKKRK